MVQNIYVFFQSLRITKHLLYYKLYPTLVQYFNIEKGIQCKILDLSEIPGETSDIIANHLKEILIKNNLTKKVIGCQLTTPTQILVA